jgi:ABC-type nickel/cobalt efflux system permease component RcnA
VPDRLTPRNLVALGVSGGLVPCPSALVVLLSAITLLGLVIAMQALIGAGIVPLGLPAV